MGVKQLWKILAPCAKKAEVENKTLAVDTSIWLHHYKSVPDHMIVFSVAKRIFSILYNKIRPVFVFDGKPSAFKRETLERRKEQELRSLIRRVVLNKKCMKCGETLRNCRHINDFDEPELRRLNEEALEKLKNHNYNWGELSESVESESCESIESEKPRKSMATPASAAKSSALPRRYDDTIATFDSKVLEGLTRQQQLEKLVDLRSKRKLTMGFDNSNSLNFSQSQIENVKRRNKITSLIRSLNKDAARTVQSDCTTYSELRKDEDQIYRAFCYKEDEVQPKKQEESESSDLEAVFEGFKRDEWEDVFEKYDTKVVDRSIRSTSEQARKNMEILRSLGDQRFLEGTPKITVPVRVAQPEQPTVPVQEEPEVEADFTFPELSSETYAEEADQPVEITQYCDLEISNSDLQHVQRLIIDLLNAFGLPYIVSLGESDAQCGYLNRSGLVDGIISEDNDMIIYRGTVYKNFFRRNKPILSYSYRDVVDELGLDQTALIKIGYLLGSDYCEGVRGVGVKTVVSKLDTVPEEEITIYKMIYSDENVKKVDEIKFGVLNKARLRAYLIGKGLDQPRIDELMLYARKVLEE